MRQLRISSSITNRESISLEKYLQEISRVELISPEEESRLAALIKKGDQQALDKLTRANLRFVNIQRAIKVFCIKSSPYSKDGGLHFREMWQQVSFLPERIIIRMIYNLIPEKIIMMVFGSNILKWAKP